MKIIFWSDLHIHNYSEFNEIDPATGFTKRAVACQEAALDIIKRAEQFDIKGEDVRVVFAGDLFHVGNPLQADIAYLASELFALAELDQDQIVLCPGQHDLIKRSMSYTALDIFRNDATVMSNKPQRMVFERNGSPIDVVLTFMPNAATPDEQRDMINSLKKSKSPFSANKKNILVGHFLVQEILEESGVNYIDNAVSLKDLPDYRDVALFGDYHRHVHLEDEKAVSIGIPLHQNWGDKGQEHGGYVILDVDTMEITHERLSGYPRFREYSDAEEFIKETPPASDFYRVTVKSDEERDRVAKSVAEKDIKVKYRFETEEDEWVERVKEFNLEPYGEPKEVIKEYCEQKGSKDLVNRGLDYYDRMLEEHGDDN